MSRQPALQRGPRLVQQRAGSRDISHEPIALGEESPELLRTSEAAAFLRFEDGPKGVKAFFAWAHRWSVPRLHRGRTVLWERRVLLAFLHGKKWTRRHQSVA